MRSRVVEGPGAEVVGVAASVFGSVGGGCRGFEEGGFSVRENRRLDARRRHRHSKKRNSSYAVASVPFCFAPFFWRSFLNMLVVPRTKVERERERERRRGKSDQGSGEDELLSKAKEK